MRDIWVFVFFGVVVSACNSQRAPNESVQVSTNLDSSRQLSTLSDSEAQAYCGDINVFLQSQLTAGEKQIGDCAAAAEGSALGASGNRQAACQISYNQCIQAPAPANILDCVAFAMQVKLCSASVSAYDQCIAAATSVTVQLAAEGPTVCGALPDGGTSSLVGALPAACLALPQGCVSSSASGAVGDGG